MMDATIVLPSKPKIISEDNFRGIYEIEGLYPGYGHTLGNSLRRMILSSLVGAAITSVKVDGASHEFATLPGVKEDLVTLVLNLKKVRFRLSGDEPRELRLSVKGAKTVTAADIEAGGQADILNPDEYLATLTDKKAALDARLTVEKGLGYVPKEFFQANRPSELGVIYLNAVFTPIRRASYEVENMRVGDRTDFNRLRLSVETDGTITPREAWEKAIEIIITQLRAIIGFKETAEPEAEKPVAEDVPVGRGGGETEGDILKTPIGELGLPARVANAWAAAGVRTAGGLVRRRETDLLEVEGLGERGLQETKKILVNLGLTLKD